MTEQYTPPNDDDRFDELALAVIGELASEEDHQLLQSTAYQFLEKHGIKQTWGQHGYQAETGQIVFKTYESTDIAAYGQCANICVTRAVNGEPSDAHGVLLDVTFGPQNQVIDSYTPGTNVNPNTYEQILAILLDISSRTQLNASELALFDRILMLGEEHGDLNDFWDIPMINEGSETKHFADIVKELTYAKCNIYVEDTTAEFADNNKSIMVCSNKYIGDIPDDEKTACVLPILEIIQIDRDRSEDLRYYLYADGDTEYIARDPRDPEPSDYVDDDASEEDLQIETLLEDISEEAGLYSLPKVAFESMMADLLKVPLFFSELDEPN